VWYKLAVYCSYSDAGLKSDLLRDCTDFNTVKASVKAALANTVSGHYNLAVYPDVVEELFMDYVDPAYFEASAPPYNGDCPGYTVFNVLASTIQESTFKALQPAVKDLDHNTDFLNSLKAKSAGVQLCGVAAWLVELKTLGHFDQLGTYTPSGMDIAPGVAISKPGVPTPASTLSPGDAVKVSVFNFPAGGWVRLL